MSLPEPEYPLDNICSVIHDNTLYAYSTGGFQSLDLTQGAQWERLDSGESVEGAQCVMVTPEDSDQNALWVVGGQSSTPGYMGLQRFIFSSGNWETIRSQEPVAENRRWHGAAYLRETDQIVTYAGNNDGTQHISTSSFTIRASEPYDVQAYESSAPPATNPLVLRWSDSQIMLIGGDGADKRRISLFNADSGWTDSGIELAEPLPKDTSVVKAILVDGDDGSKNLLTFDMSEIPNRVQRIVLVGAGGEHIDVAEVVGRESARDVSEPLVPRLTRRDLTLNDWPTYNDTLAPETTRVNYALAESDGMVVLAGGNDNDPISMFDVRENSWENATLALASEQQVLSLDSSSSSISSFASSSTSTSSSSSSSSASSTGTSTTATSASASASASASSGASDASLASSSPSATQSVEAAASDSSGSGGLDSNAILGIILGTIAGTIVLLGLLLFCIRRKRLQRQRIEQTHHNMVRHNALARATSSRRQAEKGVTSEFEKEIAMGDSVPTPAFRAHKVTNSAASHSSMAILMGNMNQQKTGKAEDNTSPKGTRGKPSRLGEISRPIPQETHPVLRDDGVPLTGDEKAVSFAPQTGGQPRPTPPPGTVQGDGTRRSSGWNRYWSGGSALNILGFGNQKRHTRDSDQSSQYSVKNRITQDSATVPPLNFEGRPQMNRVVSGSPTVAYWPGDKLRTEEQSGKIERPMSGASSGYSSGIPESVRDTWDPFTNQGTKPWGSERAPSSAYSESFYHPTSLAPSIKQSPSANAPDGLSKQPQLTEASTSGDMSWLNLGDANKGGANASS